MALGSWVPSARGWTLLVYLDNASIYGLETHVQSKLFDNFILGINSEGWWSLSRRFLKSITSKTFRGPCWREPGTACCVAAESLQLS